jgi:hypothetical protein
LPGLVRKHTETLGSLKSSVANEAAGTPRTHRWQDSHACTTTSLRHFLADAYTGKDSRSSLESLS